MSANTLYFALMAFNPSLIIVSRCFTPVNTSGVFTVSNAASPTAQASGLPP
jgi:hypothetical protein